MATLRTTPTTPKQILTTARAVALLIGTDPTGLFTTRSPARSGASPRAASRDRAGRYALPRVPGSQQRDERAIADHNDAVGQDGLSLPWARPHGPLTEKVARRTIFACP